jgi:2-methylcitrate dehydratase PrpD
MSTTPLASRLGAWAASWEPQARDEEMARGALIDTVCVALAARGHRLAAQARTLGAAGQWAVMAHALDYDDLHLPSTSHISAVCVPVALAYGGGPRAYLAGAGVMARIGMRLGWRHYDAGWHTTATAGVFAAAVTAAVSLNLSAERTAAAIALSVSAAGGVQRAFGSDAKPLQVGMAAAAGAQAAELTSRGARPDLTALDAWMELVQATAGGSESGTDSGGSESSEDRDGSIPGGLAVKIFPCCYALQRPIFAMREAVGADAHTPAEIDDVEVRTPHSAVKPLIHHHPLTGAEGQFSLEYGVAAAVLDGFPGLRSFTEEAVRRPAAEQLARRVRFVPSCLGEGLLDGNCEITVRLTGDRILQASVAVPEGAPARPPSTATLGQKAAACLEGLDLDVSELDWASAARALTAHAP